MRPSQSTEVANTAPSDVLAPGGCSSNSGNSEGDQPGPEIIPSRSCVSSELSDTDLDRDDEEADYASHEFANSTLLDHGPSVDSPNAQEDPTTPEFVVGESITYLQHIRTYSKLPSLLQESTLKEALVVGAGSFRSVTLVQSLVKVFDKVYCIGPLSIKKKLSSIPNVELIEGNVWEPRFGENSHRTSAGSDTPDSVARPFKSPSNIMTSFFKPSSPAKSPFSSITEAAGFQGTRWDFLSQRVSHVYVTYGCFGIVSQKEFMSIDLRLHVERKVHAVIMNVLELAAVGRAKRIIVYTHLNSQLASCPSHGNISEAHYSTIDQLIDCENAIETELSPRPSEVNTPNSVATTTHANPITHATMCSPSHRRLAVGLTRSNMYYILSWIDLMLEAAFMFARDSKGYNISIFRMPSDLIGTGDIVVVRKHVAWTFLDAIISLGLFPTELITETILSNGILHPLDEIMRDSVAFSLDTEGYPIYHFIRKSEMITTQDCLDSFKRVGIMQLRCCNTQDFQQALRAATDLSPLHVRAASDLIDFLSYPGKFVISFSTILYDHDKRRVLHNNSGPGSGARLQNLYAKVLPKFSVCRTLDTCLLALIKRGHLRMTEVLHFADLVDILGARSNLHKACVCGKLKGCDCARLNLLDTIDNGWSRIFQESRAQWLERRDVESYAKHLALSRMAALCINTLNNMCQLESDSNEAPTDVGNPVELHLSSTSRQMFVFGTGIDLLLSLVDIDKRLAAEKARSRPLHVVQNFELLNMYGYTSTVRPFKVCSAEYRVDPRASELNSIKTLCAIAGLDISCQQLCPLTLLGRSPQLAVDFDLPQTLKYYKDEIKDNMEVMNSICCFQNRFHSHMSRQYRDISCWIYSYDLQFSAMSALMQNILNDHLAMKPTCVIIHRPIIDVLRTNYSETLSDYLRISLAYWTDFEDQMAIQFARDHPNLQPPRHFAVPLVYDELCSKPHISINTFLTKLIQPPMAAQSNSVISEIYERYLSSPLATQRNNMQKNVLPATLEKQTIANFAYYHVRWQNLIQKCQTESIIWQRMNNNCMEASDHYDEQGRMKIIN